MAANSLSRIDPKSLSTPHLLFVTEEERGFSIFPKGLYYNCIDRAKRRGRDGDQEQRLWQR
jgi:hypothetical protein